MLTICHPTTFLFLEIVNEICNILNIASFSENTRDQICEDVANNLKILNK